MNSNPYNVTQQEASEAGRELNEKKHSWNPFASASDAGKTLEAWREVKKEKSSARQVSSRATGRATSAHKRSAVESKTSRQAGISAAARNLRRSPSMEKKSRAGKKMENWQEHKGAKGHR